MMMNRMAETEHASPKVFNITSLSGPAQMCQALMYMCVCVSIDTHVQVFSSARVCGEREGERMQGGQATPALW